MVRATIKENVSGRYEFRRSNGCTDVIAKPSFPKVKPL
jgi:hypothetical protein